ncbi:MAG: endonuclease domain-containing protein [Alphaproteobacteria bacterium]|uniref:Endonuclease domain-containing protein n=1 Tax=Candidatus Nitrobium versatile TaxID=2884831 RepID=A0A953JBI7_9BACT|nr:endonuclease domain-containing protein [Candidatus Nitrobium versatile]
MPDRLIAYAKDLRDRSTDAERLLWTQLRTRRLGGLKFRRQHPIGSYIVDFVCLEKKLVIELDGGQHAEPDKKEYDKERDAWLEREGYRMLRFWDNEVLLHSREVLEVIREHCVGHPPLHPLPSREGTDGSEYLPSREGK